MPGLPGGGSGGGKAGGSGGADGGGGGDKGGGVGLSQCPPIPSTPGCQPTPGGDGGGGKVGDAGGEDGGSGGGGGSGDGDGDGGGGGGDGGGGGGGDGGDGGVAGPPNDHPWQLATRSSRLTACIVCDSAVRQRDALRPARKMLAWSPLPGTELRYPGYTRALHPSGGSEHGRIEGKS